MRFLGIDLAAKPEKTSVCILDWTDRPHVTGIRRPATDQLVRELAAEDVATIGIDSPFGWPDRFLSFIQPNHGVQEPRPLTDAEAEFLKYRQAHNVRCGFECRGKRKYQDWLRLFQSQRLFG